MDWIYLIILFSESLCNDLAAGEEKIIDIALKYGYDSPDSFTRAFTRFHGVTPTSARKEQVMLKTFTVIANEKVFPYEGAKDTVPQFWQEHYQAGKGKTVMGVYGINIDESMGQDTFVYLIADPYNPAMEVPEGFITRTIPEFTWAVFPCRGAMPDSLQDENYYCEIWIPVKQK